MKGLIRLAIAVVILAGLGGLYLWLGKQNKPAEAANRAATVRGRPSAASRSGRQDCFPRGVCRRA